MALPAAKDLVGIDELTDFQYFAEDGTATESLFAAPIHIIPDYIYSPARWASSQTPVERAINPWTLDSILARNIAPWSCIVCSESGMACDGDQCVRDWRTNAQQVTDCLEIKVDPDLPARDFGVYLKAGEQTIPAGSIMGEWLGELLPPNTTAEQLQLDDFAFDIEGNGAVSSLNYGNWTRFVHHTCVQYNVLTRRSMYGRRLAMTFIARTDILPGDQLFINYGADYFQGRNRMCDCEWGLGADGEVAPHLPPTRDQVVAAGRVFTPEPEIVGFLAHMRAVSLPMTPYPQIHRPTSSKETRTFDIDVSVGGKYFTTKEFTIPRSALGGGLGPRHIEIDLVLRRRKGAGKVGVTSGKSTSDTQQVTPPPSASR